jgi:lipopolysaccharide/colanic/teichoic acid biosynthesis glycosyltransferase
MEPVAQDEGALLFKRCFDLTVTLLSMPVVLPLMGIVALAIKLDSPGPVLFIQQRVGLKKRLFPMMKFRSMCDRCRGQAMRNRAFERGRGAHLQDYR